MKPIRIAAISFAACSPIGFSATTNAQDASWGCQVLLCSASQKPSWSGVPYCVAPMTRLITAMKKPGFSWPICHEANAGGPGYERFEECPAGTTVGYSVQGDQGGNGEPDQCVRTVNICMSPNQSAAEGFGGAVNGGAFSTGDDGCIQRTSTPRPQRSNPYFFDIPNDKGVKERFWFNLNR